MNYVSKSLSMITKNLIILIPVFIALLVPALMVGNAIATLTAQVTMIVQEVMQNPLELQQNLMPIIQNILAATSPLMGAGALGFILMILAIPIMLGLMKRSLNGEEVGFGDFLPALKENVLKNILFYIGCIVVCIAVSIVLAILSLILGFIANALGSAGGIIMIIFFLAILIFGIYFGVRFFCLWLPSMVIDDIGVVDGAKKGFATTKGSFWTIFLVCLITAIILAVISFILGFTMTIAFVGPLVMSIISTIGSVFIYGFLMALYHDKKA